MADTLLSSPLFIICPLLAFVIWLLNRPKHKNLPPSPPSLPIIGHLHLLKQPLHRTLHSFSQKYGPVVSLQFGSRHVVIVSSPSAVEECFTKNDIVFANRPPLIMGKYLHYDYTTLANAPYGEHWRNLRRLSSINIFSTNCLNNFSSTRREEVKILLAKLYSVSGDDFGTVELRPMLSELSFNLILRMITGKRYCGDDGPEMEKSRQFRDTINDVFKYSGASYIGDFLPVLQWFDYDGFLKRARVLGKRTDMFLQGLIDDHRSENDGLKSRSNTLIGQLLSSQQSQPEYYTDEIIKGLILTLIFAGTDTSSVTLEWAMSNLLNHPEIMDKVKNELDAKIGQECLLDESDLSKLPYLRGIIHETMRLYPPGPLLVPHFSHGDCTVRGYNVPRDTMLLVNAWAIHRDPNLWEDATKFKPERFDNSSQDDGYKLMPFGFGRRACPGNVLANRIMALTLGSMIQCFEWKRKNDEEIDMAEGVGLTMPMAKSLEALCKAKKEMNKVLSSL